MKPTLRSFFRSSLLLCAPFLLGPCEAARADFALHANDRVVFYGDSITEQRRYSTFAETFIVTRFPNLPLSFVHSGWSGDRVNWNENGPIDVRLQRDAIAYQPTIMTIMLGMNDGGYNPISQSTLDAYSRGYLHILDTVQKADPNVRFTLVQPSPYDDVTRAPKFEGGYNGTLLRLSEFVQTTAKNRNLGLADFNAPLVSVLQRANTVNPGEAQKIIPDRIHPGDAGALIMAGALLRAWGAPSLVSDVAIDAKAKKVVQAQNTRVSNLQSAQTPQGAALRGRKAMKCCRSRFPWATRRSLWRSNRRISWQRSTASRFASPV